MATAQPPLQSFQSGASIVRFMTIALATGLLVDIFLPADASNTSQLLIMFVAGIPAGLLNRWLSYRFPTMPSMPSGPAPRAG